MFIRPILSPKYDRGVFMKRLLSAILAAGLILTSCGSSESSSSADTVSSAAAVSSAADTASAAAVSAAESEAPAPVSDWTREELTDRFRGTTYAKVNAPFAPYDVIDAYYKKGNRQVSYNSGATVADSIYERKYLEGADQYAVFFNSNQADTVAEGDGTGRLLILKDSYANCFAQFCVDDFAQTHLIDLRFFRGSVQKYVQEHEITEVLVLYNVPNFAADTAVSRCAK